MCACRALYLSGTLTRERVCVGRHVVRRCGGRVELWLMLALLLGAPSQMQGCVRGVCVCTCVMSVFVCTCPCCICWCVDVCCAVFRLCARFARAQVLEVCFCMRLASLHVGLMAFLSRTPSALVPERTSWATQSQKSGYSRLVSECGEPLISFNRTHKKIVISIQPRFRHAVSP